MSRKLFPTADDCEAAFYDAFERADLKLMMTVWADEPDIICIHPQGARLAGTTAVRESFAELFAGGPNAVIKIAEWRKNEGPTLAVHCLYENFTLRVDPTKEQQHTTPVLATNVFMLTPNGWRMILHHASLSPHGTVTEEQGVSRILH